MKEYKVVQPKIGFRNRTQKYEDVNTIFQSTSGILFERDKNR